jgi:ATP-dependent DNA helicase RecQ
MKDQVTALVQNGVPAAYINSSLTARQYAEVLRRGLSGRYKLIYVAPERLETASFQEFCQKIHISMITVDEAHCISQWGQDFRPSYLKIVDFIAQLPVRPVISAFTATATARVKADIIQMLALKNPHTITTSFDRKNLYFEVQRPADKDTALLSLLNKRAGACGIIYCQTRKTVERVCTLLKEHDFPATRYHAGLTPEERQENQEDFLFDRKEIMVATNAFGMGIDKSNVSYVIHYNMPASMESYYQEAGRAGRDGSVADCILLYHPQDGKTARFLIEHNTPSEELTPEQQETLRLHQLQRLEQMEAYCTGSGCLRRVLLNYFGEALKTPCGNCSRCLSDYEDVDTTQEAQKLLSCICRIQRLGYHATQQVVLQVLRGELSPSIRGLGLEELSTFGLLKELSDTQLTLLIEHLISRGMLRRIGSEAPILTLTEKAKPLLYGKQRFTLRHKRSQTVRSAPKPTAVNQVLFAQLSDLRKRLADRASVPSYALFTDKSLREMCRKRPVTVSEFQKISGVGTAKANRYAKDFISVIQNFQKNQ